MMTRGRGGVVINRVAASLAPPGTESCLAALRGLAGSVALAEVRLDLMESFDLARLIRESPCPLIITCRPAREGGRFRGSEAERLSLLVRAAELGCAYIDVEWDSIAELRGMPRGDTGLIVSRHWADPAPEEWLAVYESLRDDADVVKLVCAARCPADVVPVFELLRRATRPVIAIAMGKAGAVTRLLAPCFDSCLLTYGAAAGAAVTAPGQFTVAEMIRAVRIAPRRPVDSGIRSPVCGRRVGRCRGRTKLSRLGRGTARRTRRRAGRSSLPRDRAPLRRP